jgi:hypothetical protein
VVAMSEMRETIKTFTTQLERIDNLEALKRNLPALVNHDYHKIIEGVLMKKISPSNLLVIKNKKYPVGFRDGEKYIAFSPEGMRTRYQVDYGHSDPLELYTLLDTTSKVPTIWADILQDMGSQNRMTAMKRWSDLVAMSNELIYLHKVSKFIQKDLVEYTITKNDIDFRIDVKNKEFKITIDEPIMKTILGLHRFEREDIGADTLDEMDKIISASKVFELVTDEFIELINKNYASLDFQEIDRCVTHIMTNLAKYQIEYDLSKNR